MAPRFIERISRKANTLDTVFGDKMSLPPAYSSHRSSIAASEASSRCSSFTYKNPPPSYMRIEQRCTNSNEPVLPPDSLILVTGANSFQGTHIVDQLLERGYRVRGSVRDAEKAAWTSSYFEDKYGVDRYTALIVPDMAAKGAFNDAVTDCSGIIHVASVTSMSSDPNEVVTPTIAGALNALEAAAKESTVTRFVYTSSVAAAISHDRYERREVSSHTWNMADFSDAWSPTPYTEERAFPVYSSAKMQTEAAIWRWHEVNKPKFVLNTVLPDTLWGQIIDRSHQSHSLSVAVLKAVWDGHPPEYPPGHFVDVQDSALLHVAALLLPDVQSQRIFAVCRPWSIESLVQLVKRLFPYKQVEETTSDLGTDRTWFKEAGKAQTLLMRMGRKGWTDIETSVRRNCESFY